MDISGGYDLIRYQCRKCGGGTIEAAALSQTRVGLVGFCERCEHRETAWFDLLEVTEFVDGERQAVPIAYMTAGVR